MWNRCTVVKETLDRLKPSLALQLVQIGAPTLPRICVELVDDVKKLIKIVEVIHNNDEVRIDPAIGSAEAPTKITMEHIRVFSEWGNIHARMQMAEDREESRDSRTFYKKSIKMLEIFSLKNVKKDLEKTLKSVSNQVKKSGNQLSRCKEEKKELTERYEQKLKIMKQQHQQKCQTLEQKLMEANIQLQRTRSQQNTRTTTDRVQNRFYEHQNMMLMDRIRQLQRQLRIQDVGGPDRSYTIIT